MATRQNTKGIEMNWIMRKAAVVSLAVGLLTFGLAGPAQADGDGHEGPVPKHGHVLVLGMVWDMVEDEPTPVDFRKCVNVAGGKALKNIAHHDGIHAGKAGAALVSKAGHAVAPTAPLWPEMGGCADLEAMFGK
jgi:hypothetical protein